MAKYINWKSNWFNSNFELFVDGIQKGAIKFNSWTSNAETVFEDQHYLFTNVGFWQSKTNVIDRKTNELIAIITYDSWKSKAIISMKSGEQYEWKPTSFWKSEWIVSNFKDTNVLYSTNGKSGTISSDSDNKLLIIAGLFIKQIYNKKAAAVIACFMPIMVVTITRN